MTTIRDHSIKVNRALALSDIGPCRASAAAMLDAIPRDVVAALPSHLIARLIDANWQMCQRTKAIADAEAIREGAVWDAARLEMRSIC